MRRSGWQCEAHPDQPVHHRLANGQECGWAGAPCEEPGCPDSGALEGWRSIARVEDLDAELDRLSRQVIETFGPEAYEAAFLRANVMGRPTPDNPGAMNLALRDELKRLLGPH